MAEMLCRLALELLDYCEDRAGFDAKVFDVRMKNFAHLYKRAGDTAQSDYHMLWRKRLMER